MKSKTIEVDQDRLTRYIAGNCPFFFHDYYNGASCMKKVDKKMCEIFPLWEGVSQCPTDCPRITTKEYGCDKGRCPKVKATIQTLKA